LWADNFRERQIAVFVLINRPCRLNIPHLAMNLARSQENRIQPLAIDMLPQLLGRKCALWIAQHSAHTTKLLRSRNYVPPRTAFYCDWLKFLDEAAASQFLQTWPRYDLPLQCAKFVPNMPNARLSSNVTSASGATISQAYQPTSAGQPQSDTSRRMRACESSSGMARIWN
jgi:hypothetical protein